MHKQVLYTGLRLGLYDHLTAVTGEGGISIPEKIAFAGIIQLSWSPENCCHAISGLHRDPPGYCMVDMAVRLHA